MTAVKNFQLKKGLSFVEVMYSIVLLAGAMAVFSQISYSSNTSLNRGQRYELIANIMEEKLSQLELEFQENGEDALVEEEFEKFEDYPEFLWSLEKKKASFINPDEFSTGITASNELTNIIKKATDKINNLIIEVKLTIHYDGKQGRVSYPVSAYFIDFKKIYTPEFMSGLIPQGGL